VTLPTNTAAESHNPIYIWGDSQFEGSISTSGVRSGDGTEGDPYIISDWEIVIETEVNYDHGVVIRDTEKHFIIRNVTVSGTSYNKDYNYNGIYLWNADNGTVENCTLTGWLEMGIYTTGSNDVLIRNNTVSVEPSSLSDRWGIQVYSLPCVNITVDGNNVTSSNYGVAVYHADDVVIKNNRVSGVSDGGMLLWSAEEATVWNNTMTGCGIDLWVSTLAESNSHIIPQNNTVNGLSVHYIHDETDVAYDGESVGQLIFANCVGVTVSDMSFSECDVGIQAYYCEDVSLSEVTVTDTLYNGVTVGYTDEFNMTDSAISGCGRNGLELWDGAGFIVSGCTIESNQVSGIYIAYSERVNVTLCSISYHDNVLSYGIDYRKMNTAIDLQSTITYNELRENTLGVSLSGCRGVTIHHNNFIDNTEQASDSETDLNQWDDGSEGNYWSDYSGEDSPPDGIGDTAYDIDGNTYDNYPLMEVHVIPEFGHVLIPVIIIIVMFGILLRKRNE
jgi:parallel beta-helix repeat protein